MAGAASCHDATAPPGADARLVGSASTQVNLKTAVCHAAGSVADPKFVEVRVGGGGAAAHLDAGATPRAGHESDYLVTARTPCPPPPTEPNVRVCKAVNSEYVADRTFEFDVNGESVSFRGRTRAERTFRVGTPVTITETIPTGLHVQSITITPPSAGTGDIADATATVVAGTGRDHQHHDSAGGSGVGQPSPFNRQVRVTIGEETTQVRYVKARRLVELRICKVSPPGFTATTRFHLDIGGVDGPVPPVDVPANGCAFVTETGLGWPGVSVNARIRIAEVIPAGQRVAANSVDPSGPLIGPPDLVSGVVHLGAGPETTTVTFHNVWTSP